MAKLFNVAWLIYLLVYKIENLVGEWRSVKPGSLAAATLYTGIFINKGILNSHFKTVCRYILKITQY